jgi:SEC-C motif domain protein
MDRMPARSARPRPDRPAVTGCPCGRPAPYDDCCGRLHRGQARAANPEELMRSRFSAFAVGDEAYLLRTWHPSTRPARVGLDPGPRWLRLEVLGSTGGGPFHSEGTVEFRAHYRDGGRDGTMHENSRFTHHEGAWVYLDGTVGD